MTRDLQDSSDSVLFVNIYAVSVYMGVSRWFSGNLIWYELAYAYRGAKTEGKVIV